MSSPRALVRSAATESHTSERPQSEALALVRLLQRSLDPKVVIETFARQLARECKLGGLAFQHVEHGLAWGSLRGPAYAIRLKADGELLGQLEVYRREPLTAADRERVRELAGLLVRPLRNALRFSRLQRQACEDGLTGLLNRHALERILPRELAAAERNSRPLALVVIDLNDLKLVNDVLGHAAGDRLLKGMAAAIEQSLRRSDMAFRVGGDEFVLILPGTDANGAAHVIERIRSVLDQLEALPRTSGHRPSFSAGVSVSAAGVGSDELFECADQAMYSAKRGRRDHAPCMPKVECSRFGVANAPVAATMTH